MSTALSACLTTACCCLGWPALVASPRSFFCREAAGLTGLAWWAAFRMVWHLSSLGSLLRLRSWALLVKAAAVAVSCSCENQVV